MREHSHAVAVEDGELTGLGADWLVSETASAQFVLLGEDHNLAQIPPFAAALFKLLQTRHGFHYFAAEQPGLTLERLSAEPLRGDLPAIGVFARHYPFAFSFIGDEELAMLASIGALSKGRSEPLWGLEQATGVALYVQALVDIVPGAVRPATEALLARALAKEVSPRDYNQGTFIIEDPTLPGDLANLRKSWAPDSGSRGDQLLRALEHSRQIYDANHAKGLPPAGLLANTVREDWFREQFLRQYQVAVAVEQTPPKVLLKFGAMHMVRGRNIIDAYPLGNFLAEFAHVGGMEAFNLTTVAYRSLEEFEREPENAPFVGLLPRAGLLLIDLRPLRPYLHDGGYFRDVLAGEALRTVRDLAFGYDAVLVVAGATPKHSLLTGAKQ